MQSLKSHRREAAKEPQVACIRLTRGSADDSVWVLEEGVGGTFLTVGSDPECDWQVRAAGVMPQALSVLLIGGMVYVRSGPRRGVRLNGAPLGEEWTYVNADARVDIGMATLEIKLAKDAPLPSLFRSRADPRASTRDLAAPAAVEVRGSAREQSQETRSAARHARPAPSEHERSGMRRSFVPQREARTDARALAAQREQARRRHEQQRRAQIAAARRSKEAGGGVWLYLIGCVALAGAYVFWLSWLD